MKRSLAGLTVVCGLILASPASFADTITLDLNSAVFTGGASVIGGPKIKFDSNVAGQTATFTLDSVPGTSYVISVTASSDQSASFLNFFIDADGPGAGGFVQLGGDINFNPGFVTIALPSFIDLGTTDFFKIVNGGTGNSGNLVSVVGVTFTPVAVPGPMVGAGLPGLMAACGALIALARRRRNSLRA